MVEQVPEAQSESCVQGQPFAHLQLLGGPMTQTWAAGQTPASPQLHLPLTHSGARGFEHVPEPEHARAPLLQVSPKPASEQSDALTHDAQYDPLEISHRA